MKRKPLWKISIVTTREAEEAVAELCQGMFGRPAVSYTDVETGKVIVSVYLAQRLEHFHPALREGLARIRGCGLKVGAGRSSLRKIGHQDWTESWKRHFKPIQISPALMIKPSWSRRRPARAQAMVALDPGLSFGTGQHATTAFCLRQLAAPRVNRAPQSILDIGTGSGILAIAAAKLGYAPVDAFDYDPDAVRAARSNARRNRVHDKVHIWRADLRKLPSRAARRYDLICANLISSLLISERRRIIARLKPAGRLILAGILKAEFGHVARAYARAGLKLVASRAEKEWRSGAFNRV